MKYSIELYEVNGKNPVEEYLKSLPKSSSAKVSRVIKLLEENGPTLGMPFSKALRDGIFELRAHTKDNNVRVLYFFVKGRKVVLTNGFDKKTNKTPVSEINLAISRKEEYITRGDKSV